MDLASAQRTSSQCRIRDAVFSGISVLMHTLYSSDIAARNFYFSMKSTEMNAYQSVEEIGEKRQC